MIYVLLDTNIIIDMVVDRRNQINNKLLNSFIKLMDYNEIKLVVPEIIKTEVYRNLEVEFTSVGKKIQEVLDNIKGLYGVSTLTIEGLNLTDYKKNARKELNEALAKFESNKSKYKEDIFDTVDTMLSHKNCVQLKDISLMDKVLKRKIYKRAPFHKVKKESNGDGVITETLININDFISINTEDIICFVTGNYKDFSDSTDKNSLHNEIVDDLEKNGLKGKVHYVRTFGELVNKELKSNLEHANLTEEFEQELKDQEAEEKFVYETEISDLERESAGLSSLGSFDWKVEETFSDFQSEMEELSYRFSSIKDSIEEITAYYDEEFIELISDINSEKLIKFSKMMEPICSIDTCDTINDLIEILEWRRRKLTELEVIIVGGEFENIEFGNKYNVFSVEQEEFTLNIDAAYLSPSDAGTDEIDFSLLGESEDHKLHGGIHITYGFMDFDDDGGIGNAIEESVELDTKDIVKQLEKIANEWGNFIDKEQSVIDSISDIIDTLV